MKYSIEFTEILQKSVQIEADSAAEAYRIVKKMYSEGAIELNDDDFIDVDIKVRKVRT